MLDTLRVKRLHGDWEAASRLRHSALLLLSEATRRYSMPRARFDINNVTDDTCLLFYRFTQRHLRRLQASFQLPAGLEGLCITLHRPCYPTRWMEMSGIYGRWPSALSSIFYFVIDFISERCSRLLKGNLDYVSSRLHEFSQAIYDQGAELDRIWGFVDGTVRGICRPGGAREQQCVYSGHKRKHALKFQTVATPDGMIFHLHGPAEGRRHDILLLRESGLEERVRRDGRFQDYFVYGDQAYGRTDVFVSPFKGSSLTPAQAAINASMSKVRTSVEWPYGQVVN
ncbi:hypothetical protein PHYSODRAFT_528012 [Phytophthora sojae]|uniref:DDE Tnp4 domain-containing protein n=1 Tax=Phytophthora sojae (strain P6497) TaxID=1094619 RepID=G5AAW2_PHYSP|nr:hypothetical protein PHYSODRAFT_528012 [Phytophthora sojae]EGZ07741.1 hypothetical protein PHYSODRAFT_528012 [Phytophthora sojae]|eukprot:XP_009537307.1 hypothetical protein PHYSODRAFT_528012 [Phytophthora sojae]